MNIFLSILLIVGMIGNKPMADVEFTVSAIDKASSAITGIRGALLSMNQAVQLAGVVFNQVTKVVEQTVGAYVKYADEVRRLSQLNGTNAQETSRLIQVTDDYKISVDALTMATRQLSKDGQSLTTNTLAKMSDQYIALGSSADKTKFLLESFGRSGLQFAEIMQAGSQAIRENSAAIEDGLILTGEAERAAREYEKALDNWNDSQQALNITLGQIFLPILMEINNFVVNKSLPGWGQFFKFVGGQFDILIQKSFAFGAYLKTTVNTPWGNSIVDRLFGNPSQWSSVGKGVEDFTAKVRVLDGEMVELSDSSKDWMSFISGTTPKLEDMALAAYRDSLAYDGLFDSMDALAQVGLAKELYNLSDAEVAAYVQAVNLKAVLDTLKNYHIVITVDMIGNMLDMVRAGANPADIAAALAGARGSPQGSYTSQPAPSTGNPYWIPDPSNPGHYIVNPSHNATGGRVPGRYAITGDSVSGQPTGYEELVDFQTKQVYNAQQTRSMLKHGIPRYAVGSSSLAIGDFGNAGGTPYILDEGARADTPAIPRPGTNFDLGAGPDTPPFPRPTSPIPAVTQIMAGAQSVSQSASTIAASGMLTAASTQQNTKAQEQANRQQLEMLAQIRDKLDYVALDSQKVRNLAEVMGQVLATRLS